MRIDEITSDGQPRLNSSLLDKEVREILKPSPSFDYYSAEIVVNYIIPQSLISKIVGGYDAHRELALAVVKLSRKALSGELQYEGAYFDGYPDLNPPKIFASIKWSFKQ
jgi:hypothetical protein